MRKTDAFRRAAALMAALSITVSLAAPAFADIYYIDDGDIIITKDENGRQTVKRGESDTNEIVDSGEIIITTREQTITTLESDLEGPAAEDSGFGPVVEDNYQPAPPAQPEDAEEPKDDDQKNAEESENDEEQKDADRQKSAEEQESAGQQPQPQQAAPAAAPAASTPVNKKENGFWGNTITVINKAATALKLTLRDVKIDVSDEDEKTALSVQGDGNVEIELDGDNELKSGFVRAGLEKNTSEGTLTLKDDNKDGSLKATGGANGAGIGGSMNNGTNKITIKGGTVEAKGGLYAAGIGGGIGGGGEDITIKGGRVTATGGDYGAGIGGGSGGSGKNITINGGTVTAAGGFNGAGIGGGIIGSGENITITGGEVKATGGANGAGIGGDGGSGGSNVTVSGAAQVTATAGKGSRYAGAGATIGGGGSSTQDSDGNTVPTPGTEIQADIKGLTTGYIHHIIYEQDGTTIKREWWEPVRPQPNPEDPNAPTEESNEVDLGTPLLHVETLKGAPLLFNTRQQGSTLRVTTDNLSARLHGTRQALETLQEQGVEQIQFVTTLKTTTLSVEDLLAEGGSWFALEHNGLVSRRLSAAQAESLKCRMR